MNRLKDSEREKEEASKNLSECLRKKELLGNTALVFEKTVTEEVKRKLEVELGRITRIANKNSQVDWQISSKNSE